MAEVALDQRTSKAWYRVITVDWNEAVFQKLVPNHTNGNWDMVSERTYEGELSTMNAERDALEQLVREIHG